MTKIQESISELPDEEFAQLRAWIVTTETDRRNSRPVVEQAKREAQAETVADISQKLAEQDTKLAPPAKSDGKVRPWKPWHPTAKDTHFYYDDKAEHNGKTWRNVVDETRKQPNVWEPGAPGIDERYWVEEKAPEPEPESSKEPEPSKETEDATTPAPAPAAEDGSQAHPFNWEVGKTYTKGQFITLDGKVYKMAQTHTAVSHYRPGPGLESIYQPV